ncbi:MAG: glucose 1-dehydrogenase [Spirochaetia bacterium]|nr:glucose 1-dehydrogenase [Spirochaetia bacterium]
MFKGKTIVITGAARGIGLAMARHFLKRGGSVILSDERKDELHMAGSELEAQYPSCVFVQHCDVRRKADVAALAEYSVESTGRLDIWINNAGIVRDDLLVRMSEEKWDHVQEVNLKGAFLGTQAAAKQMLRQKHGRILNIGSVSGFYGNGGQINYSSAKAGLVAITKSAARELASRNITVNCIASGFIDNEFASHVPLEIRTKILDSIPLKIGRNPEEAVASAAAFLVSDDADWITGATLRVDGGMMIGF